MPVISVCGAGPSVVRAHVAVNLAAESALAERSTLLIDLDPRASATRQLFRDLLDQGPDLASLVRTRGLLTNHARTLRIHVRSWLVFSQSRILHVIAGAELEGQLRLDAAAQVKPMLDAARERFDVVVVDVPRLSDSLGKAAAIQSERMLVGVRAGPAADHEIKSFVNEALALGVPKPAILHLLIGTDVNKHIGSLSRESIVRLLDQMQRESRSLRVLQTEIRHDVELAARHGLEVRRRDDWVRLAAEVLADCETPLPRHPSKERS